MSLLFSSSHHCFCQILKRSSVLRKMRNLIENEFLVASMHRHDVVLWLFCRCLCHLSISVSFFSILLLFLIQDRETIIFGRAASLENWRKVFWRKSLESMLSKRILSVVIRKKFFSIFVTVECWSRERKKTFLTIWNRRNLKFQFRLKHRRNRI